MYIDGVKYIEWTPKDEEKEFHPLVKKNYRAIFGENTYYFDIKPRLYSKSGIGGIPDAYVIDLDKPHKWYIIENELSAHDVYEHIVGQVSKFMALIGEYETQRDLAKAICSEIDRDEALKGLFKKMIGPEVFRFVSDLLSCQPKIVVVIDKITPKLDKAVNTLERIANTKVVELRTFLREKAETVQAYLFEPIYDSVSISQQTNLATSFKTIENKETTIATFMESKTPSELKSGNSLDIRIRSISERKFALLNFERKDRRFFPPYKIPFILETDIGEIRTSVTAALKQTAVGDPIAGVRVQGGLIPWFKRHPEVDIGSKVRFECIVPHKRYRLTIL